MRRGLLLLPLLLAAACGGVGQDGLAPVRTAPPSCASADAAPQECLSATARQRTFAADVVGVRAGRSATSLVLDLDVPSDDAPCASGFRTAVEQDPAGLYLTTTQVLDQDQSGCTGRATVEHEVVLPVPVGRGVLVIDAQQWGVPPGESGYSRCLPPFGCGAPPADRCDEAWIDRLLGGTELPPERRTDVVGCDGSWLVLDVDAVVTGCQSVDGQAPPVSCEGSGTRTRWFARFDRAAPGWQVLASGTAADCEDVEAAGVPLRAFPRGLCRGLAGRT